MIDNLVLLMIHVLLGLAGWRMILRNDLDEDPAITPEKPPVAPSPAADGAPGVPRLKRLQVPRD